MRRIALLVVLIMLIASTTEAQQSGAYRGWVADSSTATTSWDSTYVGGTHLKYVDILHNGTSGILLVAQENDTTAGKIVPIRTVSSVGQAWRVATYARWVRTKVKTSGTIQRDIVVSTVPPSGK